MTSKKILCVIDDLGSGGAQRQLVNIAIGLKEAGYDISFLTYFEKNFYQNLLTQNNIKLIYLNEKNSLKRIWKFRTFIRKSDFDIVISFLGVPSFLASFAAFPYKKFQLIVGERSSNPIMKKSIKSRLLRLFYFKANFVVANSFANINLVKYMLPWLNTNKLKVIYNVIDLEKYRPLPEYKFKQNGKFRIVIPASYRKLKNLLGLIEAVNLLNPSEKNALKIDWYGDRNPKSHTDSILIEAETLIAKYKLENIFNLNDVLHHVNTEMVLADAVGLFSFFEGLPNAICEGMACGKPIIATEVSDIPLLIKENENGFLCTANDVESIANALSKILALSEESLQKMGSKNLVLAKDLFNKKEIISQYQKLFISN